MPVPHPDFVAVGPRRIIVVGEDDSTAIVEPLRIVSLDYKSPRQEGGDGSGRRGET